MLTFPLANIRNVLCLGAHSDDIEIGCGGTLLKLQEINPALNVVWIVFSSDPVRKREALESAGQFLAKASDPNIQINDFPDRYFPAAWSEIKDHFSRLAQELSGDQTPDLILTHRLEDRHQDHRVVAELTWNAFRNHFVLEYEIPKFEGDLGQPNVFVPLSSEQVELKTNTIVNCFPSQQDHQWFDAETFRSLMRIRGLEANSSTRYAEGFYSRKLTLG
jgi:LmbE family N-acetylglucosaminyl deacetylase